MSRLLIVFSVVLAHGMVGCDCEQSNVNNNGGQDLSGNAGLADLSGPFWVGGDGPIQIIDGGITIMDDGGAFTCYQTICDTHLTACGDCLDNDGDGRVDWRDPECLGPCDNTEGAELITGVGGETGGPCKADCYFDYGNGPGNDDCHWDHRCDPLAIAPNYPPEGPDCKYTQNMVGGKDCPTNQSTQCLDYCRPLTPNGCDCFGCCTFPELNGGYIWLGAMDDHNNGTCTFATIMDQDKCPPCTPVAGCNNTCEHCELCLGKTELPADCYPPDGGVDGGPDGGNIVYPRCSQDVQPCGLPGDAECPVDYYCLTGCCIPTTVVP